MRYVLLTFAVVFALVFVAESRAGVTDPRLNAVASAVAGHPVVAECASNDREWISWEDTAEPGAGANLDGFTQITAGPNIYLSPRVCTTLFGLLTSGPDPLGPWWSALAIKTIIHESVHQRGITDESVTDCTALGLVKQYAVSSFGYPATVTQTTLVRKLIAVRVGKVVKRVVTYVQTSHSVPNPALDALYSWALAWHRALPAQYQGAC